MHSCEKLHPYLTVSGASVGVGKTTLGQRLSEQLGYKYYPEPDPYKNRYMGEPGQEYLAETQWFLDKVDILKDAMKKREYTGVVVDVPVEQDIFDYARFKLQGSELEQLIHMYETYKEAQPEILMKPSLVVFVEAWNRAILHRVHKRGRDFEQNMTEKDINKHRELNYTWIQDLKVPVVVFNTTFLDVRWNPFAQRYVVSTVQRRLNSHEG